jgi:fucose permease
VANRTNRSFDLLSLGTFVVLGLPDGMLGTAWPAMRRSFGAPIGDLGLILLVNTAGAVVIAAFVGALIRRLGIPALLAAAGMCFALGGLAYALAPGLWLVLSTGALMGAAAGMMDGGLNTAVALTGRRRLLNLLHGFYGIGTAVGPLVVTGAIVTGSWRSAYLVLVGLDLVTAVVWLLYRLRHGASRPASAASGAATAAGDCGDSDEDAAPAVPDVFTGPDPSAGWSRRRVLSVLTLGMAVFFVYTGLEVGAGQWETSFARGHLGLSASAAGLAAFGYWGALTAVRIGLALPSRPVPSQTVIRWGCAGSVVAAGLIWWQPDPAVAVIGFVVLGGTLAGVFPALISVTPLRIGEERAQHAIAWQVGAAAAGGSAISALIGLLIDATSLAVIGPSLIVLALLLVGATIALTRLAPVPPH